LILSKITDSQRVIGSGEERVRDTQREARGAQVRFARSAEVPDSGPCDYGTKKLESEK
jgi:hypothetical protein